MDTNEKVQKMSWWAKIGNVEKVKNLLDEGFDTTLTDDPIVIAADEGHTEVVAVLLDAGMNGDYALVCACRRFKCYEVVELLLKKGVNVHAVDGLPLYQAIRRWDTRLIRLLLSYMEGEDTEIMKRRGVDNWAEWEEMRAEMSTKEYER